MNSISGLRGASRQINEFLMNWQKTDEKICHGFIIKNCFLKKLRSFTLPHKFTVN